MRTPTNVVTNIGSQELSSMTIQAETVKTRKKGGGGAGVAIRFPKLLPNVEWGLSNGRTLVCRP